MGMLAGCQEVLRADDLNPPSWPRLGASNRSTSAEWDFDDDGANPLLPDGDTVPLIVGDFKPMLDAAFPGGAPHPSGFASAGLTYTGASGFLGTAVGGGTLAFNVPNWIDQEPFKFLRLQVTYTGTTPGTGVFGSIGVSGGPEVTETPGPIVPGTAGQSLYFYQDWTLQPNPDWEQVVLFVPAGTFIDQVVIDSISTVPEPSALALGMIGLFVMGVAMNSRAKP
jgi:hypothetical protein